MSYIRAEEVLPKELIEAIIERIPSPKEETRKSAIRADVVFRQ